MKLFDKTMKMISLLCLLVNIGMISCDDNGVVSLVARVGEDVVLPCSLGPEKNIKLAVFDWMKDQQYVFRYSVGIHYSGDPQLRERVSHFPDQLNHGNASIVIRNIQLSDSGNYSCFFPRLQQQRFYVELVVGIFAEPHVMILEITECWALLRCEVRGASPKPQISWIDSDGKVLPAEEKLEDSDGLRYLSILMLQTNVTKTGIFRCRVTQQKLNHITEAPISVPISNGKTVMGSDGVLLGVAIGSLTVVLLGLVAVGICWYRIRAKRVYASHSHLRTTQNPCSSLKEEVSRSFMPQPVNNQDRLDHSPWLAARTERPNAINSRKAKQPVVAERRGSGDSSPHPSHPPAERPNAINSRKG